MIYGVAEVGGAYGYGIIYSYDIATGVETDLHDFGSNSTDAKNPYCTFIQVNDSLLFGTTANGGAKSNGTIFKYNRLSGNCTVVHSFGSGTDGINPYYEILLNVDDSILYGTTKYGGVYGQGIIFSYNLTSGSESIAHSFGNGTDGKNPLSGLIQASNGLLYGTTQQGGAYGSSNGYGTIYIYDITTGTETDIHDFGNGTDGRDPYGSLIEVDTATIYAAPTAICAGDSVLLTAFGSPTYTWSPATGLSASTGDSVIANPHVTTTYTVTGTGPIPTYPTTVVVTVNPIPVILVNTPAPACAGQSVNLTAMGGTTYTWYPSTGLNKTTGSSVVANTTANTTYTVIGSSKGCADTTQTAISVIAAPPLIIQPISPTLCSGQSDTLYVSGGGAGFTWSPSTGLSVTTGSSVVANPVTDVTYTVTGINSLGYTASGTDAVTVIPPPNQPIITVSVTGDTLFSNAQNGNQWYRNGTVIKGATDSFLVITGFPVDTYKVEVTDVANGCSSISNSVVVNPTGINQLSANNYRLSIYPNPTTGQFTIKSTDNQNGYTLEVYNVLGEKIYQSILTNSQNTINLSAEPPGLYLIYLKSQNDVEVGKVMVTK